MANCFLQVNEDIGSFLENTEPMAALAWYRENLKSMQLEFYSTCPTSPRTVVKPLPAKTKSQQQAAPLIKYLPGLTLDAAKAPCMAQVNTRSLISALARIRSDQRSFFIVSTNYAHHFSWALSRIAFNRFGRVGHPKVVINIDKHTDFGGVRATYKQDRIACGNWGQHHLRYPWYGKSSTSPMSAFYIALGCTGDPSAIQYVEDVNQKPLPEVKGCKGKDSEVLKRMDAEQALWNDPDLYLTVDRDVYTNGATHYRPGDRTPGSVDELWDSVMMHIGRFNLVGFDITGLPKYSGMPSDGGTIAVRQILEWQRYVTGYFLW
ncbi:MAG: hypothetical protein ABIK28_25585 [Planctomycetota bacterium]